MAEQSVEEVTHLVGEPGRLPGELCQGLGQPVGQLDRAARQAAYELVLVVSRDAQRAAGLDHPADEAHDTRGVRATVDQVTQEDRHPACGRVHGQGGGVDAVPQPREQVDQLLAAAVDVADDVERPGQVAAVASLASWTIRALSARWTLVASTTVSRPRRSRVRATW